jgi:hypothetical protein
MYKYLYYGAPVSKCMPYFTGGNKACSGKLYSKLFYFYRVTIHSPNPDFLFTKGDQVLRMINASSMGGKHFSNASLKLTG